MSGRGKKINPTKNHRAWQEWMQGKKLGRGKQRWVWDSDDARIEAAANNPATSGYFVYEQTGHWEKV